MDESARRTTSLIALRMISISWSACVTSNTLASSRAFTFDVALALTRTAMLDVVLLLIGVVLAVGRHACWKLLLLRGWARSKEFNLLAVLLCKRISEWGNDVGAVYMVAKRGRPKANVARLIGDIHYETKVRLDGKQCRTRILDKSSFLMILDDCSIRPMRPAFLPDWDCKIIWRYLPRSILWNGLHIWTW